MEYIHYKLGNAKRGQIVEIRLAGSAANVRLMNQANYEGYVRGGRYGYIGGRANKSPVHIQIPEDGIWNVTIDMRGLKGSVKAGYKILPDSAKPMTLDFEYDIETGRAFRPSHDIFFLYAEPDKLTFIDPLSEALRKKGVKVWPNGLQMDAGDSFRNLIEVGHADSWVGVIVLSRAMLKNNCDRNDIITKNMEGLELNLLIRHEITPTDVNMNPSLFSKPSISAGDFSFSNLVDKIFRTFSINKMLCK